MERTEPHLRDELGGRWAISLRTGIWALPIFIIGTPLIETHPFNGGIFLRWSLASTLSLIPAGLLVWIAHKTYFKNRAVKPRPFISVVLLGISAGFVKGILLGLFGYLCGAVEHTSISEVILRGVNSAFIGSAVFPLISLFMVFRARYVVNRAEIISEILRLDAQTQESKAMEFALRQGSVVEMEIRINEMLKRARSEFEAAKHLPLEVQWERLSKILRDAASQTIRPLSHTLHRKNSLHGSNIEILGYVLRNIRFEILWVILFYLITNVRNTILFGGLSSAIGVLATRIGLLTAIMSVGNKILQKVSKYKPIIFALTGATGLVIYSSIEPRINKFFSFELAYSQVVLEGCWIAFLIIVSGYFGALLNKRKIDSEELEKTLKEGQIAILQEERRNNEIALALAKHLHGTVQSRLMGSAMAIENAGRKGDFLELNRQIDFAYEHLQFDSIKISNLHLESLSALLSDTHEKWGSLMNVKIHTTVTTTLSQDSLRDLSQVITEALSNSFRHGSASEVEISLDDKNGLNVVISDNGSGYFPKGSGLGSEYFGLIGGPNWSISNNQNGVGTTLKLKIEEL